MHQSDRLEDLLHRVIGAQRGSDLALLHRDEAWSYEHLLHRATHIGQLATEHTARGGMVAVVGENHPDWVAAYYGIPAVGRVVCFLNHRLAPAEIAKQLKRARATLLLCSPEEHDRLASSLAHNVVIHQFGDNLEVTAHEAVGSRGADPAWLLFTSGTTGTPKGALLSHSSILAAIDAGGVARPIDHDEVFAFPFPLCHVAGYNVLRLHQHGRPVVLLDRFDPATFVSAVGQHRVTSASLAATMLSGLLDHLEANPDGLEQLASLRSISYGASPMPAELLVRADTMLGVALSQGYGMTELSGNAVFLDADDHRRGLDRDPSLLRAAGRPGIGVDVEVRDPHGAALGPGRPGEIFVRGAQVMVGYLDDDEATASTIVDGWLATGDGGRWRDDGVLEVVDRLKDVIVSGGENIASLEVERAMRSTFDELIDVAVVGVPDSVWGENVCAVVVERSPGSVALDGLVAALEGILAGFKIPRHLVVVEALPLTHSGKIAKADLRRWLVDHPELLGPRRSSQSTQPRPEVVD